MNIVSDKPLSQKDPAWNNEVLLFFRDRKYETSLDQSLAYWRRRKDDPDLLLKDKANVLYTIIASAYGLIQGKDTKEWEIFFSYLEDYCRLCRETALNEGLEGWNHFHARTFYDNCLELLARFDPRNLPSEAEKWSRKFLDIQAPDWGRELVFPVLVERIFKERMNLENPYSVSNTENLGQLYLDLTEEFKTECIWGRSQVMNILSDVVYFQDREDEALVWVQKCQEENPRDTFSSTRKQFLLERRAVQYQIRRFHHDTNTTFAGLQTVLQKIQSQPQANEEPLYTYIKKLESNLDRLHGVLRFVQERQAEPEEIDPREIVEKLELDYASKADIQIQEHGNHQTWIADPEYLMLAVDNVLKNAVEAFEEQKIAIDQRWIRIEVHYQEQMLCVQDNAGGIDPQYKEKIFEPFVSSKGVKKNTGLGLYHARQAMAQTRGRIDLASTQPEQGTRFEISLGQAP